MKRILILLALFALCLPATAQFRRSSDNGIYPYNTNLIGSDVFIIGRPGVTNYNYAYSNLNRLNLTNVTIVNSNIYSTNIYTTNLYAGNIYSSNFYTTNFYPTFTTNLYITNLQAGSIYTTNLYTTNLYSSNIYTTNITANFTYTTNLFAGDTYTTNLYVTNLFSSNIYTTNLYATNAYITNLFAGNTYTTNLYTTNIFANTTYTSNAYITNLFSTNAYITNLFSTVNVTSNLFTTNLFTTNLYTSNLFATNIFSTNAYITNLFSTVNVTSNLYATNIYTTNLFVNNLIASNANSDFFSYTLSNSASIGATSVSLNRAMIPPPTISGRICIGFGTTNAEIRPAGTISGHTVSFSRALTFAHTADEKVLWFAGDAHAAWFGAVADTSVDAALPLVQALYETGMEQIWLDGDYASFWTTYPLVMEDSGRLKQIKISAKTGYVGTGHTNAFMLWNSQGDRYPVTFTAVDDKINTGTSWSPPVVNAGATNTVVIFYGLGGTNLPAPLSNGIPYFVKAYTTTNLMVGLSTNAGEVINITGNGSGFMKTEVGSLSKMYLQDVHLSGDVQPNLNGIWSQLQQMAWFGGYVRADDFGGTAFRITGQDAYINRLQALRVGVGIDLRPAAMDNAGMQFLTVGTYNGENFTNAITLSGSKNKFGLIHLETCLSTTSAIIDGSLSESEFFAKQFYFLAGANTNTIFKMGNGTFYSSYNIEEGFVSSSFDGTMLLLDDLTRHRRILNYSSTQGANRYFDHLVADPVPSSAAFSDMWGGWTRVGLDGRAAHIGMQYGPFVRLFIGTNDTTDIFQVMRYDGSTNVGVNSAGNFYTRTNAATGKALTAIDNNGVARWDYVNQVLTNSAAVNADFNKPYSRFTTNAAFLWLSPANVDTTLTRLQVADVAVTNSTAAAILTTFAASVKVTGTPYITNLTYFHWRVDPWTTNCLCEPVF